MGMLLWRHRVKKDNPPKLTTLEHVTPKPKAKKSEVDFRKLDYNSLKSFAKTKGVDLGKYRKHKEILEQLEQILG